MSGKDKEKIEDLEADFFGDEDLDWLDDDSEVVERKKAAAASKKNSGEKPTMAVAPAETSESGDAVAPPPPPPFAGAGPGGSVIPRDQKEADWAQKVTSAPKDSSKLSNADTLVFSQVPTLPPIDPDSEETIEVATPAEIAEQNAEEIAEEDMETAQVERSAVEKRPLDSLEDSANQPEHQPQADPATEDARIEELAEAATEGMETRSGASPTETPTETGDAAGEATGEIGEGVLDDPTGDVPLVRTKDPTPIRMEVPEQRSRHRPPASFSPPTQPRAAHPSFAQTDGESAWREMATALMNEAAVASADHRSELLFRAGWVYHHKLADLYGAESLYRDALNAGSRNPSLLGELADVSVELGRWNDTAELLQERAGLLDGIPAGESLREAANIHLRKLQNPGAGVGRLWDSLEANAEDYASLVMLRDHLSDVQPERAEVLGRLAAASRGAVAAEALYERGRLLDAASPDDALEAYRASLEAYPDHAPTFLALEEMLTKRGDHSALAALYASQAEAREGTPGEGWWRMLSGRHHLQAGETEAGEAAYAAAAAAGWSFAFRERQARLFGVGAFEPLAASLLEEIEGGSEAGRPFLWYRLGWIRERHLKDWSTALEAYQKAVELDPSATPAIDAVRRVLVRSNDTEGLMAWLEARLEKAQDVDARKSLLFRLAETAEDGGDHDAAVRWYRAVVDADPESESGLAGLSRCLRRTGGWGELQSVLERRAGLARSADLKAHFLSSAAMAGPVSVDDPQASIRLHRAALDVVPDHLASLEAILPLLEGESDWDSMGELLRAAAETTADRDLEKLLLYRAGRVLGLRTDRVDEASGCLRACLEIDADFEPARRLELDLSVASGDTVRVCSWYQGEAHRVGNPAERDWCLFASAVMSGLSSETARADLRTLLGSTPDHPGARGAWEVVNLASNDVDALTDIYRSALVGTPTPEGAKVAVRLASILLEQGRAEDSAAILADLGTMRVEGRPLHPAARIARRAGAIPQACDLLSAVDEPWATLERASLLARRRRDREEAVTAIRSMLDRIDSFDEGAAEGDVGLGIAVALVATRIGGLTEDRALMAAGRAHLAQLADSTPMALANALWSAQLYEDLEQTDAALVQYQRALSACPSSAAAADGVFRCMVSLGDGEGILALRGTDGVVLDDLGVAAALSHCGLGDAAIEHLDAAAQSEPVLPALLYLEHLQQQEERWQDAYATLVRRNEVSRDETQQRLIESKRRWMLAEKLSDTDEALEHYEKLHQDAPEDREVTEALARIAGARGNTDQAIGLLGELAEGAETADESARYKRRIAEAHVAVGDRGAARQAYLDALDYVPSDPDALAGLKSMASEDEDWPGLVQVLQREADLVDGDRELEVRREIARVTEDKLGQGQVAIDAWRNVLEIAPQDLEALQHLLAVAEAEKEWGVFIESGNVLSALSSGAERTALLRRIGVVCIDELKRDDAVRYFEQAIAEAPPDLLAARRLEQLYAKRSDWKGVERALDVQGRVGETLDDRVAALERAARLQLETHHDREAASTYYKRILEIRDDHENALRFMASHLFEAGRFDEALPVCERLEPVVEKGQDLEDFDTRMELAQFYFYFAEMLRLAGDSDEALGRYARALELNPTHLASLEAAGPLYCEAEEWKKAERVYRQLLQLSGGQGERHKVAGTYTQLGKVERALGNAEKAQKRFNKALEIYPNHVDALKGMALLLEDREDWSNLLNIYNNIIYHATVAEDVIDAYMTKGRILDDHMSRPDKAAQHYQRSLDFKSDQPFAILRLAELEMRKDNYREAAGQADRALRIVSPDTEQIRALLLLCQAAGFQDAGRTDDATKLLSEARSFASVGSKLDDTALEDLEALRQFIKESLP